MLPHLSGPANYLATREPAPVIAGRQRTYVTDSHSLTSPYVALQGKMCVAERQTNTVQRRFISRSHIAKRDTSESEEVSTCIFDQELSRTGLNAPSITVSPRRFGWI
jgi:hypothetical protein